MHTVKSMMMIHLPTYIDNEKGSGLESDTSQFIAYLFLVILKKKYE